MSSTGPFELNTERLDQIAGALKQLNYRPVTLPLTRQIGSLGGNLADFVFFMTAIDYNTRRQHPYEAVVDGRLLYGSDLLYALAMRVAMSDARFFTAPTLVNCSEAEAARVFTSDTGATPSDLAGRAALLRQTAAVLIATYDGRVSSLLRMAEGRVAGLLALLEPFSAYSDPLLKKAFLLIKLLHREGLFDPFDLDRAEVPIDHVLTSVALSSGMLSAPSTIGSDTAIHRFDPDLFAELRAATRLAAAELVRRSGESWLTVDDLLWSCGRELLRGPAVTDGPVPAVLDGVDLDKAAHFLGLLRGDVGGKAHAHISLTTVDGPPTHFF